MLQRLKSKIGLKEVLSFTETHLYDLPGSIKKYELEAINKENKLCSIDVRYAFTKDFLKQGLVDFLPLALDAVITKHKLKYIIYFFPIRDDYKSNQEIYIVPEHYLVTYDEVIHYYIPDQYINLNELEEKYKNEMHTDLNDLPLLSFIIPTYNSSKYIEQVLQSILAQSSFPLKEIVIVDALSEDNTIDIVKKYITEKDLVISEKDNGIFDAINKGTKLSKGQYSLFLGSDDILLKEALLYFKKTYLESRNMDFYFGDFFIAHEKCLRMKRAFIRNPRFGEFNIAHPALFIKKSTYLNVKGFSLEFNVCSDADFELKLIKTNKSYAKIHNVITIFRAGGFSELNLRKVIEAKKIFQKHGAINLNFYKQFIKFYILWIFKTIIKQ